MRKGYGSRIGRNTHVSAKIPIDLGCFDYLLSRRTGLVEEAVLERTSVYYPIRVLEQQIAASNRSVESCTWFRSVRFASVVPNGTRLDAAQSELYQQLISAFEDGGHLIQSEPSLDTDLIIEYYAASLEGGSLWERIEEVTPLLMVGVRDDYRLGALHPNLVVAITVTEDLLSMSHVEVEETARMVKARLGTFKMLFVKVDPETYETEYYMFTTIEGGHPVVQRSNPRCFEELRDRLVTHACANEAGGYEPVTDAISVAAWRACESADFIADVGRWMGQMGHLDAPWHARHVATAERARMIGMLLGWQRQAAGAMIAFAPDIEVPVSYRTPPFTGAPIVTCTGRDGVDKTNLHRDTDLVAVSLKNDILYAFGVEGRRLKGPSIEGDELVGGMMASPAVRLSPHPDGYVYDPDGEIVVPRIWGIVHTHRAVEELRPIMIDGREADVVKHVKLNIDEYPYAVGCGKDMMFDISRDGMARTISVVDEESPALVAMFDVANHGTNFFIYCAPRPGTNVIPRNPFENFYNLLDPAGYAAIKLTTEVPQV